MEVIKLGFHLIIEFCLLEKRLVATLAGIPIIAWLIGVIGGIGGFSATFGLAVVFGLIGAVAAFFTIPKFVQSSYKEINYSMDWIFQSICLVGAFIYVFLTALPILACFYT